MICIALGLGLVGLIAWKRARWRRRMFGSGYGPGCAGHGCGGPGWGGHGWGGHGWGHHHHGWSGHRGGRWRRRAFLGFALERIEATPAQERAIVAELDRLEERLRAARGGLGALRGELAEVVRGPVVDDAALAGVTARIDLATGEARAALTDALRGIHALLDDTQRAQVADLLGRGAPPRGPAAGPYRT